MTVLKKAAPYISGIVFSTIFGFSFLIVKNTLSNVEVFQLIGLRFLTALVVFEILRLTKIVKIRLSKGLFRSALPVAVFSPILYFLFEVYGIKNAESGEAGLMIGMIPVAVAITSWIFLKEKLNIKQAVFMAMSLGGVVLISIMQMQNSTGETKLIGFLLLAGAVLSAAFYNILSRKTSVKYSPMEITYVMMVVGAVVFSIIGITDSIIKGYPYFQPMADPAALGSILYLGVLSSIIAFFCVNYTLSKIPAVQSALFANLVTVISVVAGVLFLNESFPVYKIIGSLLIITGVFGTNYFHITTVEKQKNGN